MACYSLKSLEKYPELAAAIGDMMIAWAHADEALIGTIARILGSNVNMVQAGYYRLPTFESRVKFAQAIIAEWDASGFDKAAVSREIVKLGGLASTRNHWVHGQWCRDDETNAVVVFDHRSDVDSPRRRKPVKAADVKNHSKAVLNRADRLGKLIDWDSLPL